MRKIQLANGGYYHIYNRGVDKRDIFLDSSYYTRFLKNLDEFNSNLTREQRLRKEKSELSSDATDKLVEVIAFCLNPNHYHLILKQLADRGIEKFMHKLSTGYTNYFNKINKRSGALFQGPFKSININSNEYLLYISAYVNYNDKIHGNQKTENYKWSSLREYLNGNQGLCNKTSVLEQFRSAQEYIDFAKVNAKEMQAKKEMEKLLLE